MSIRPLFALVCALALITAASVATAAEPAAVPPAAATQADPRAEALVRRYLAATHFERNMDSAQAALLPVIAEQMARQNPELSAADRQLIVDTTRKVMREKMMPQMLERMVPVYAATFSIPELEAMVAFYESPVGRSITDKVPSLGPKSAATMKELMPVMLAEVLREVIATKCADGGCGSTRTQPKPSAS
jgi:hypothetical protein